MQGNVLRSSDAPTDFNIVIEAQVAMLLKNVRHSTLDPETKDDIRDIIFEYRTTPDESLVAELQMYVSPLGITVSAGEVSVPTSTPSPVPAPAVPVTSAEAEVPEALKVVKVPVRSFKPQAVATAAAKAPSAFGRVRPAPALYNAIPTAKDEVIEKPAVSEAPTLLPKEEVPAAATPAPTPAPAPVNSMPVVPATPAATVAPVQVAPAVPLTKKSIPPAPVATPPAPAPSPAPVAATAPESAVSSTPEETAKNRIAEIKHIVNKAVGNPVHLIDVDNEVGRAYMNSLLEAMKAVPTGGPALTDAMQKLETAFIAVEKILVNAPPVAAKPAMTPVPIAKEVAAPPPPAAPLVPPAAPAPVSSPKIPVTPVPEANVVPAVPVAEPVPAPIAEPAPVTPSAPPAPATPPVGAQSVAAVAAAQAVQTEAKAAAEPTPVVENSDPLQSDSISAGISQLLSEWKLFKSSGMFGTGPSGIEHPLYKELQHLKMNLIITGRFEGATPEVRQSITDYMNGWRYEQGMTHEMQETFETYLRRVIKSILDKR